MTATRRRETEFDLIRGLCIISMACGHIAGGSTLHAVTHLPVWVDGAMGFVLISGLVLGIVHRQTNGSTSIRQLLRRIRLLYIWHILLAVTALTLGTFVAAKGATQLPAEPEFANWPWALLRVASLTLNPPMSILGMYIVLLAGAIIAIAMLRAHRSWLLFLISLLIYMIDQFLPWDSAFPGQGAAQAFQLGSWQILFTIGLLTGWHWRGAQQALARIHVIGAGVAVALTIAILADLTVRRELFGYTTTAYIDRFFVKLALGPGAVLYTLCFGIVLYSAAVHLRNRGWLILMRRPVETIGRRGLDCYLLTTAVGLLVMASGLNTASVAVELLGLASLVACLGWVAIRDFIQGRKELRVS